MVPRVEGQELKTWVIFQHDCQHRLLMHFPGTFRISEAVRLCIWFSQGSLLSLKGVQPNLGSGSPGGRYWFILLLHFHLLWGFVMNLYTWPSVKWGQNRRWGFLGGWSNDFKGEIRGQRKRQDGRRLQLTWTPCFFLYRSQNIFHEAWQTRNSPPFLV